MSALPSFVELMATLGLSDRSSMPASQPQLENSFTQPPPMTPESPRMDSKRSTARSSSSPSLREAAARYHPRYSPYSSLAPVSKRRGSVSSVSSLDVESSPRSPTFTFPSRSTTSNTRRYRHRVTTSDSSCDMAADMPISTYVRRKTPTSSPVTPNFDSGYESASPAPMPFSIPMLPVLLSTSNSTSAPTSPISDSESDAKDNHNYYRFVRQRRTGTRLSAPPRSFESDQPQRRKSVFN